MMGEREGLLNKTGRAWAFIVVTAILLIPMPILLWIIYSMFTSPIGGILWTVVSSALVFVLIARSLLVLINFSNLV